ncbi:ATP-binding protein [Phormidium sp. CCY1219]|uniref:ATP-binding protein n=1 Tax=Phormidium sp. CCY1219 TaxID=2886104 RepID=UPI002D1E972E|nr:ATP-binding protein [Phormidium sp. CCY1219]MEB3830065.1 response regulator [Phormidium sp. CCY1219]
MSKILVVDDDGVTRLLLKRNLQLEGYQVILAKDGAEGLQLAREERPDLIICDWVMPHLDGVEVCGQLKADPELATIFFILLTVREQLGDRIEGLDAGADEFLSKPIENEELLARVRAGLRLRQLTQQLSQANKHLSALVAVQQRLLATVEWENESKPISYTELLEPLGEVSGASRVYLCELKRKNPKPEAMLLGEWVAQSADRSTMNSGDRSPDSHLGKTLSGYCPFSDFSQWLDLLARGESVTCTAEDFPPSKREKFTQLGIRSLLMLPLMVKGELFGAIGLENSRVTPDDSALISILQAAAGAISVHRDRSAALVALRKSEARYRAIVEDQTESICRFDPHGTLTFVNDAYCRNFGLTREEVTQSTRLPFRPSLDKDLKRHPVITREERVRFPNGQVRWHQWTQRALFDYSGDRIVEFQAVGRDITERKQAEQETLKALAKEKELNELKTHFVSLVSHEFRNPLTAILSSADLLEYYLEDFPHDKAEKKVECLQRIQTTAVNMSQLIDDVLLMNRSETGRLQVKPIPLDLREFCQGLIAEIEQLDINQHQIQFVAADRSIPAKMDDKLLRHILNNLLVNALKYSPAGSEIRFQLSCADRHAIFTIADRGIGIPPEDLPHLFQSFHRCRNVGAISGTGMGLSIVKKCVELHGGEVSVTSQLARDNEPGQTTFTVRLPLTPETAIGQPSTSEKTRDPRLE